MLVWLWMVTRRAASHQSPPSGLTKRVLRRRCAWKGANCQVRRRPSPGSSGG
jgi:hypothetical protein